MPRRIRSDSASAALAAMKAAQLGPIEPPPHVKLRPGDRAFWDEIVGARARESWTAPDLSMAGNLARAKADVERLQGEIDAEGDVVLNAKGTLVANPKHALLETLSRRAVALSRMLHVHAQATVGRSQDQPKRNALQRAAEADLEDLEDDNLIPRFRVVR